MRDTFDDIDRKLIALLQENDRLSLADLSTATGSASSTINDRIKRLVRNGVITGFHARLSSEALGLELLAFVLVGWSDPKVEPNFIEKIQQSAGRARKPPHYWRVELSAEGAGAHDA